MIAERSLRRTGVWSVFLFVVLGIASAPRLDGATLRVPISIRSAATGVEATVKGRVKLTPVQVPNLTAADTLTAPVEIPGLFAYTGLEPGTWMIEVLAPGHWHQPRVETVSEGELEIPFQLWQTATIAGSVAVPKGRPAPREILVRFQSAPAVPESQRITPHEVRCPIIDLRWGCDVPAGLMDVRVRAVSYQTSFRWSLHLEPGQSHDWGEHALRRGTVLVGMVAPPAGVKNGIAECKVLLEPFLVAEGPEDRVRRGIRTMVTKPNERGFFHLEGIAPGEYSVTAVSGQLRSRPIRVRALADREIELLEPLVLETPSAITIRLLPARDPDLKPWRVTLFSERGSNGAVESLGEGVTDEDGAWQHKGLFRGSYKVLIGNAAGARWAARQIEIRGDDPDVVIEIPIVRVTGSVKLGDRPLSAKLHFGGESGEVRVSLTSDEEGDFQGFLPGPEGRWDRVTIESAAPSLKRTVTDLPFDTDDEGTSRLDLRLPTTHLSGEVVDEKGRPVERAIVRIDDEGKDWGIDVEVSNGSFDAFGHPPGAVRVQATGYMVDSETVRVQLREDESSRVRLVVKRSGILPGRVVSAAGPVAGARVVVSPTDSEPLAVIAFSTNASGEFAAVIPPGTREADVFVEAHGYAAKMFHLTVPRDVEPIEIPLDPNGGALVLAVPRFDGYGFDPEPYLIRGGAVRNLRAFVTAVFDWNLSDDMVGIEVPLAERGMYSLCLATDAERPLLRAGQLPPKRCKTGFLAPLGELKFKIDREK